MESARQRFREELVFLEAHAYSRPDSASKPNFWPLLRLILWQTIEQPGSSKFRQRWSSLTHLRSLFRFSRPGVRSRTERDFSSRSFLLLSVPGDTDRSVALSGALQELFPAVKVSTIAFGQDFQPEKNSTIQGLYTLIVARFMAKVGSFFTQLMDLREWAAFRLTPGQLRMFSEQRLFVLIMAKKFERILERAKPESVWLEVFYRPEAMALVLACRRKGVPAFDCQHGTHGPDHPMYAGWNPPEGASLHLLPDYFWTWGELWSSKLSVWLARLTTSSAVSGGNLTLMSTRSQASDESVIRQRQVLVSLQGDALLPEFVIEIIESKVSGLHWILRDHPRLPLTKELRSRLSRVPSVEFQNPNHHSLWQSLQRAKVHLTAFSTVAFEAQLAGTPTVFTDRQMLTFVETSEETGFYVATCAPDLEKLLITLLDRYTPPQRSYLSVDAPSAVSAYEKALRT